MCICIGNYIGIIHRGLILVLYELSCSLDQATNYETTLLNYFTSLVKSFCFHQKLIGSKVRGNSGFAVPELVVGCDEQDPYK